MRIEDIENIKRLYHANANLQQAKQMKAYMKNKFPFLGIPSPLRQELNKTIFSQLASLDVVDIEPLVLALWKLPEREFQYLALTLISKVKNQLTPSHLEFILDLIVDKSWWDSVDVLAPNFVGFILLNYPDLRNEYLSVWLQSDNIWLNRTALLFQLRYRQETDFELLKEIIDSLKHKNEFFVKKAIGWALREYSKSEPTLVEDYIKTAQLKPLSEKEGMKHILKNT